MTKKNISVCGIDCYYNLHCDTCHSVCKELHNVFNYSCIGCDAIHQKIISIKISGLNVCPIYDCVHKKQIKNCGQCKYLPCDIYYEIKHPTISDTKHQQNIKKQIFLLKEFENKFETKMENSILLVDRLNHSTQTIHKVFSNLKTEIESKYEESDNIVMEITQYIEEGSFEKATNLLDYLESLISKLRKNTY